MHESYIDMEECGVEAWERLRACLERTRADYKGAILIVDPQPRPQQRRFTIRYEHETDFVTFKLYCAGVDLPDL